MNESNFDYFDHDADIGVIGRGEELELAFINAARAMFNVMTDISLVSTGMAVEFSFSESDIELALVTWLNTLLAKARESRLIFSDFNLIHQQDTWFGTALGGPWREKYPKGTEVKGATLTMLKVAKNRLWEARCVVDV